MNKILSQICDVSNYVSYKGQCYLILGKETIKECDLDLFWSDGKKWIFEGFKRFDISPLLFYFKSFKLDAKECSQQDNLNLKRLAIKAGLGYIGKNSLVIHPKFKGRLRFKAIEVPKIESSNAKVKMYAKCESCNRCIKNCPNNCLNLKTPFNLIDPKICQAYIELDFPVDKGNRCTICADCI